MPPARSFPLRKAILRVSRTVKGWHCPLSGSRLAVNSSLSGVALPTVMSLVEAYPGHLAGNPN